MAVLSSCVALGGKTVIAPIYGPGCVKNGAKHIKGVDWAEARTITIRIRQDEFEPMVITMRQDSPYIFRIENRDSYEHFFMAGNFFRSAAIARVSNQNRMSTATCINGVRIGAMETVELRLVATRDGRYEYMDKFFPVPSLGSMVGLISVGLPLKNLISSTVRYENAKDRFGSAVSISSAPVTPVEQAPATANPFDVVAPSKPTPPTANPFGAITPTEPTPPATANPFDNVAPSKPISPAVNPFGTAKTKPKPKKHQLFKARHKVRSTTPSSAPLVGSVPDPFDTTKPALQGTPIPNPFPNTLPFNALPLNTSPPASNISPPASGKANLTAPVSGKSDTLGTQTPTLVAPVVGGNKKQLVVPTPPTPPTPKEPGAKPKLGIKAKIRAKIRNIFNFLTGK